MPPIHDACDLLAGEVLGEMAGNFFGRRKALEDLIGLINDYARALRERSVEVLDRAGFLNHLLLEPAAVGAFFRTLGVASAETLTVEGFSPRTLPPKMPSLLSGRARYRKLTRWAYDRLQDACDDYLYGQPIENGKRGKDMEEPPPCFCLVMELARRANEEVERINREVSAAGVLQTARKFSPAAGNRQHPEAVQPGLSGDRLDRSLAFSPIDIASLSLPEFPALPEADRVAEKIVAFCNSHYAVHRRALLDVMASLKDRIRQQRQGCRGTGCAANGG